MRKNRFNKKTNYSNNIYHKINNGNINNYKINKIKGKNNKMVPLEGLR